MLEKPKKELHWQIRESEWLLEKGQGPLNMLFANRIYAMKEAGQDVRKEQFEQAYALSEMFGDLELQNSLKYYIQKNWPSKEKIH